MLSRLLALDRALSARLAIRRAGFWRGALRLLAHTGDGAVWIAIGAGLWLAGRRGLALRVELIVFALIAVVAGLKTLFRRQRPAGDRVALYFAFDAHAFPSGHAARTFALAVLFGAVDPALGLAAGGWAASVSLARVALGVHFVSDVAAGAGIGALAGALLALLAGSG